MTKRELARFVAEVRACLIAAGFKSSTITPLPDKAKGKVVAFRSPGFKLDRHLDGKSVRVSHRIAQPRSAHDREGAQRRMLAQRQMLKEYGRALEAAGYVFYAFGCHRETGLFELWRRRQDAPHAMGEARSDCNLHEESERRIRRA